MRPASDPAEGGGSTSAADPPGDAIDDGVAANGPSGWVAVAVVAVAFGGVLWWGQSLARDGVAIFLEAPPFVGRWRVLWTPALWWAVGLVALLVAWWVPATTAEWMSVRVAAATRAAKVEALNSWSACRTSATSIARTATASGRSPSSM